jgi:hypothetical protein
MFQSSKKLMRAVLEVVDDMLVGEDDPVIEPERPAHPHDRTVRLRIQRRAGTVAARPMHCLSPVRPAAERHRDAVRGA